MSNKVKMDKELVQKLETFNKSAAAAAEDVLFRRFPNKILELQQIIDSTESPSSNFRSSHATSKTDTTVYPPPESNSASDERDVKKRKRVDGDSANGLPEQKPSSSANDMSGARYPNLMFANDQVQQVHDILKKECEELAEMIDKVKLWVNLSMPKIEDGDNFGVQIQEEVLNELHRSQESAYNLRDASRQNHLNRAKICSKLIKYPHVEDYTLALKEHDQKQLYVARQNLLDLRNVYAILTDILHKNINKIRSPKGNNSSGLY